MSLKIIFMGTPEFSVPTLKSLIDQDYEVSMIYTQPPKKSKRGQKINISPIQSFSEKKNIPFRSPETLNNNEYEFIKNLSADLGVVVAYGKLIPINILEATKLGFLNIHASLLPKWRGAAPIQRSIMNGDKKTGISIMKIQEKLDSGPIMASRELELNSNSVYGEVEKKLSDIGANLLIECLQTIEKGNSKFVEQLHSEATYAKKISKKEAKIDWNSSANKIVAHIHGLNPNPGAWFEFQKERIKVWKAKKLLLNGRPGTVLDENLTVACQSNSIQILEIQREGKNKQSTKDFLLGKKISQNSLLT
ncbi:MAG: methionyl-tRNA formyltransferase [Pelagibacteraceae bacterium]|jgi:methionyl-tRNA formyltransferase|nr:methionyl-tRNA formyltransferase [Candidatus Pelagibacter sp.]MDP6681013.1 methionyl-tRNA formyltransferase [Pelagibacteraceae bacterium]MDP6710508.1 methionyl-tRNA formyltransferase [Pelagibacteraceae bacterium]|tara:strand:+ start:1449 stop:2366 length:918 start_codon:yes stop_codon:yes gene_type:complete